MQDAVVSFCLAVLVAVISALITVNLALKRFYSEKWWEQKLAAYTRIIEALFQMKLYSDEQLHAYHEQRDISPEREAELTELWRNGRREIARTATIGAFIISPAASASVEKLLEDLTASGSDGGGVQVLYEEAAALDQCLNQMRELARRHLNV
jgi:protoheme ferro-lyase